VVCPVEWLHRQRLGSTAQAGGRPRDHVHNPAALTQAMRTAIVPTPALRCPVGGGGRGVWGQPGLAGGGGGGPGVLHRMAAHRRGLGRAPGPAGPPGVGVDAARSGSAWWRGPQRGGRAGGGGGAACEAWTRQTLRQAGRPLGRRVPAAVWRCGTLCQVPDVGWGGVGTSRRGATPSLCHAPIDIALEARADERDAVAHRHVLCRQQAPAGMGALCRTEFGPDGLSHDVVIPGARLCGAQRLPVKKKAPRDAAPGGAGVGAVLPRRAFDTQLALDILAYQPTENHAASPHTASAHRTGYPTGMNPRVV